ncbi:hypothetical protein MMC16_003987 [Acarospora aff. strigata]|nr:hypothetical protein [Acarospora aff. strigata]
MPSPPPTKATAYDSNKTPSDTSFRRTWDRTEYAAKAASRDASEKAESAARYEAKLQGKKYHAPAAPRRSQDTKAAPTDSKSGSDHKDSTFGHGTETQIETETSSRTSRLDVSSLIGKTVLVPLGSATGKRGRGAGFYCADCDLTYKDNVQFVDHLNSRQHLVSTGQSGEVRRVGVEEVRERLEWLRERRRKEVEEVGREGEGLRERLEGRVKVEEEEREERRRVRREKRRKTVDGRGVKVEEGTVGAGIIC